MITAGPQHNYQLLVLNAAFLAKWLSPHISSTLIYNPPNPINILRGEETQLALTNANSDIDYTLDLNTKIISNIERNFSAQERRKIIKSENFKTIYPKQKIVFGTFFIYSPRDVGLPEILHVGWSWIFNCQGIVTSYLVGGRQLLGITSLGFSKIMISGY